LHKSILKKIFCAALLVSAMIMPAANIAAAAELKAEVKDAAYESKWLNGTYPTVKLKNTAVGDRINEAIKAEVERFSLNLRSNYWLHRDQVGTISYRLTCNKKNALSFVLNEVYSPGKGASKKVRARAMTFKLTDGKKITYDDVWSIINALGKTRKFDREGLTELLYDQTRRAGVALYDEFPGTPYPPEDIYLDDKLRFHVIFQPGVVADEATGPIDIDIDEENW